MTSQIIENADGHFELRELSGGAWVYVGLYSSRVNAEIAAGLADECEDDPAYKRYIKKSR